MRRQVGHVRAKELDGPGGRKVVTGHHVEEGGLPRPVRAEDGAALADGDLHGHVAKSLEGAEAPAHALQLQGGDERFGSRCYGHGQSGKSRLTGSAKSGLSIPPSTFRVWLMFSALLMTLAASLPSAPFWISDT